MKILTIGALILVVAIGVLLITGKKHIETSIVINSTPEEAWQVLVDFENHSNWNPLIKNINGNLEVNEELTVSTQSPEGRAVTFTTDILVVNPNTELRWVGKPAGIPYIATGEHYFIFEELSGNQTKFTQGEKFEGILVPSPLWGSRRENTEKGFKEMNKALKQEVELRIQEVSNEEQPRETEPSDIIF